MKNQVLAMFDWDGVIVDSLEMFVRDFLAACHENGFTEVRSRQDILALFEENVYKSMAELGIATPVINNILKSYAKKSRYTIETVELFEGMAEALLKISDTAKIFVITSNVSNTPLEVLKRFGVTCVEDVIGAEKEKSKVKKIQNLINRFPLLTPWYIGDTKGDIIEGRQSGARTVGVAWGWHGAEKLSESSPDYIANTPAELVAVFK